VYTPDDPVEVTVRYSPRVAGWLRERGPVEEQEDGSVVVAYSVSDPTWIVRLVLQYGPEAELLGPRPIRELLVEALARVVTDDAPGAPTA
jgi:predicted DNA-binding transcriptional regulator YafY